MRNDWSWWSGAVVATTGLWAAKALADGNIQGFLAIMVGGGLIVLALWVRRSK